MEKNEYLCNVNKAEEQQFAILSSRVSSAEREKHEAQKKARLLEQKNSVLESEKADMQRQLNEKIGEVAETVKQMAQFMMGKGPVTLSDSLRDAIVAGVKEEFEAKLREEREAHSKEMQSLKDQFAMMLAAKDNEIAALKAKNGDDQGDVHGTTNSGQPVPDGMAPEDRIKQLSQQKNKCAIDAYGQGTESEKYNHGCQDPVKADDLDLEGVDVPDERCAEIAKQVMEAAKQRKDMKGIGKPRNSQPLEEAALKDKNKERVLQIGPILQSIKDKLDILEKELDQAKDPELVKAVKYAQKEYPCLLHCLKNGTLDFSNNAVEREIRRLAKYRNNNFFAGSPDGGVRLARSLTTFANCKAYNIDPFKYLCDVLRRIKTTAKDQLVNLVAHKWQPQLAPVIY